jgi:hypothetical protein
MSEADDEIFELAPQPQAAVDATPPVDVPAQPVAPIAAPATTLAYANLSEAADEDRYLAERVIDLYLPMWTITAGVVIEVALAALRGRESLASLRAEMVSVGLTLLLGTAVVVSGMFIAARLGRINLGSFWTAAFKLAAASIGAAAGATLIRAGLCPIPIAGLFAITTQFLICFALIGALFNLDHVQTWYCVIVIFLVNLLVWLVTMAIQK